VAVALLFKIAQRTCRRQHRLHHGWQRLAPAEVQSTALRTCLPVGSEQCRLAPRESRGVGLRNLSIQLGRQILEAGWHARMSKAPA